DGAGPIALPAVDAVVHAAARFRFAGPRGPYFRTNVRGTRALLEAARHAGAARFVYLSAAAVVMDNRGSPVHNVNESAPTFPNSFSAYIASKAQSEAVVLAADRPGFRTLAIRPPAIWGPGDAFSHAIPHAIGSGQFSFINRGDYPYATCHVDNVAEAVKCALERGAGGRAYFVHDREPTTFREFIAMLAQLQGLSVDQLKSVSYRLAFTFGRLMEIGAAIRRLQNDPPLTRTMVRMIGREFTTDDSAAQRELGYVGYVSRADGLATYGLQTAGNLGDRTLSEWNGQITRRDTLFSS
ncbi:MAG TPA: NAD-dependent epimerase/dehydratase family protein, partial [Nitrospira sp.]|nr:NAD-dependent epimerase/dehydratase family protein [Nitrospira sp.]